MVALSVVPANAMFPKDSMNLAVTPESAVVKLTTSLKGENVNPVIVTLMDRYPNSVTLTPDPVNASLELVVTSVINVRTVLRS